MRWNNLIHMSFCVLTLDSNAHMPTAVVYKIFTLFYVISVIQLEVNDRAWVTLTG